jgi:hypothetical protein
MDIEICTTVKGKSLKSVRLFKCYERIIKICGTVSDKPDKYSIQISENKHIVGELGNFVNHSCHSNCYIDVDKEIWLVAKRNIRKDEELTFNYNTTEYELSCPFQCFCGGFDCKGLIKGYKHLGQQEKEYLFPWLSPYLRLNK